MNTNYYVNVARTMGILPRPRLRCTLHDDRVESIDKLKIQTIIVRDCDYYDRSQFKKDNPY